MVLIFASIKSNKSSFPATRTPQFNVTFHYFIFLLLQYLCTVLTCVCDCVAVCGVFCVLGLLLFSLIVVFIYSAL